MKNLIYLSVLVFISMTTGAENIIINPVLNKSIAGRYDEGQWTAEQQVSIIKLVNIYKKSGEYTRGMLGYVQYSGDDWYSLNRNLNLQGGNISTQQYLGNWPLTRWSYLKRPELIMDALLNVRYDIQWRQHIEYTAHKSFSGCLNKTPMRYGDIENDGKNELVLFLNGELIIFSPEYQRTVFSNFLQADDWFRDPDWKKEPAVSDVDGKFYQYQSEHMIYNGVSTPAYRYYSKIYTDDFDENGNPDIILWAKTYIANEKGSDKGFHLIRNELKHYERDLTGQKATDAGVTGEYLPQITTDVVIENWMRANELTWQKGFPSMSECAGEEGQLIPEMHDPLLNDPDVLQ